MDGGALDSGKEKTRVTQITEAGNGTGNRENVSRETSKQEADRDTVCVHCRSNGHHEAKWCKMAKWEELGAIVNPHASALATLTENGRAEESLSQRPVGHIATFGEQERNAQRSSDGQPITDPWRSTRCTI